MIQLENRIPPLIVALVFGVLMWALDGRASLTQGPGWVRSLLVVSVAVIALYFCIAGVLVFRSLKTTVNPLKPESASSLVTSGVYQITRNPMYLGFALFLVSWAIFLGSMWPVTGVLGFVLYLTRFQIIPEERALISLFGSEFEDYAKAVRRWL